METTTIKSNLTNQFGSINDTTTVVKTQKLKPFSRILIAAAALIFSGSFFFSIWFISLEAPQYPEGLTMEIWLDHIGGDVELINGLNHYIGMKTIHADEFTEFKVMPWIVASLIAFGLITALVNKRWLLWIYMIYMLSVFTIGIYDFWAWEYEYGHNLDPTAAIKIPGMSYQPPLIGYKQLLNFLAGSFPDVGAYFVYVSAVIVTLVLCYEQFFRKN